MTVTRSLTTAAERTTHGSAGDPGFLPRLPRAGAQPPCGRNKGRSPSRMTAPTRERGRLLDRDRSSSALQGRLSLLRRLLVDLLEQRLRRAVNQVLRLLEAEARQAADLLDDLDLLLARRLQNDVELVLLLLLLRGARASGRGSGDGGDRGSGLDVECLLKLLDELGQLKKCHLLERAEQFVGAELRHGGGSSVCTISGAGDYRSPTVLQFLCLGETELALGLRSRPGVGRCAAFRRFAFGPQRLR